MPYQQATTLNLNSPAAKKVSRIKLDTDKAKEHLAVHDISIAYFVIDFKCTKKQSFDTDKKFLLL